MDDVGDELPSSPAPRRPDSGLRLSGRRALAETTAAVSGETAPPERLGQYDVSKRLGRGAFGEVYLGYDTELERNVALKLLRDTTADDATHRLRKEAQAMAALDHPALLRVYGMGAFEGRVFIAMEYAERGTMRDWLRASPRSTEDIVRQIAHAARGLHAAHEAGFVHRDVKPSNILIGNDGLARVSDFGLVYAESKLPTMSEEAGAGPETAMGGTPPYMAPELFDLCPPTPHSDAFALCVTLYEALFDHRPRWQRVVVEGPRVPAVRERPPGPIPSWLRAVLMRGLQADPDKRHPTLAALADELDDGLGTRARRSRWVLGVAAIAVAGGLGWVARTSDAGDPCLGGRAELAGLWDADRASTTRSRVSALELPFAASSWASVESSLDAYAEEWVAAHHEACAATTVRRERSPELMDKAMACLEDRKRHLAAFIAVIERGDAEAVAAAPIAATGLPTVKTCNDIDRLLAVDEVPPPERRAEFAALAQSIARASALRRAGSVIPARELLDELAPAMAEVEHPPLQQDYKRARASVAAALLDSDQEAADLLSVYGSASWSGRRDVARDVAQELAVALAWNGDHEGAARWLKLARDAARDGDDAAARASLAMARGSVDVLMGEAEAAAAWFESAVAILEPEFGPNDLRLMVPLRNLSDARGELDESEPARKGYERALKIALEHLGERHPQTAVLRLSRASALCERGEYQRCRDIASDVLDVFEEAYGPGNPNVADPLSLIASASMNAGRFGEARAAYERANAAQAAAANAATDSSRFSVLSGLSDVLLTQGDVEESARYAEQALEIVRASRPPGHPVLAEALSNLARVRERQGNPAAGLELVEEADDVLVRSLGPNSTRRIDILGVRTAALLSLSRGAEAMGAAEAQRRVIEANLGSEHPFLAQPRYHKGLAYEHLEKFDEALREYQASLAILESQAGGDDVNLSYPLIGIGRARIASGHPQQAIEPLERSLKLAEGQPQLIADAQVALVRALIGARRDRKRAVALADEATQAMLDLGGASVEELAKLRAFRDEHQF